MPKLNFRQQLQAQQESEALTAPLPPCSNVSTTATSAQETSTSTHPNADSKFSLLDHMAGVHQRLEHYKQEQVWLHASDSATTSTAR